MLLIVCSNIIIDSFLSLHRCINKSVVRVKCEKIIEVSLAAVPRAYTSHKCKKTEPYYCLEFECYYDKINTLYKGLSRVYEVCLNSGSEEHTKYELDVFSFFNDIRGEFVFDKTRIKSLSEKSLLPGELRVKQILPLVSHEGLLFLTNKRVYFQPYQTTQANPVNYYNIKSIRKIFKRRYMLMRIGLEFWTEDESIYLAFKSHQDRDLVYEKLMEHIEDAETGESLMHYTEQWVKGEMSNYDYLMKLNYHSYRSRSDLTQYPVFPWVIKDYDSFVLDLNNEETFRDLSKPMGALNQERLIDYKKRYNEIPEGEKYLYGTHYSAPGYVIGYVFRKKPRWMLKFQGGHFDNPNRLFKGIFLEFDSCLTNPGNVKELIPEFFEPDEEDFLVNSIGLDLGVRANGERVDDIILPKWAHSPRDFLEKHREALECDYVSQRLHLWIDLIFGKKQRSIEDDNLFHPLTYEGVVDLEQIEDAFERFATEQQINEFGQTPRQLFRYDHPQKFSTKPIVKSLFIAPDEIVTGQKLPNKIPVNGEEFKEEVKIEEKKTTVDLELNNEFMRNDFFNEQITTKKISEKKVTEKALPKEEEVEEIELEPRSSFLKSLNFSKMESLGRVHNSEIIELNAIIDKDGETHLMIVSKDGLIKLYQEEGKSESASERYTQKRSFYVSERGITCSCVLNSQESVVIGTADNNIILFNFSTGTEIGNFYAHDNDISTISVIGNNLISFSYDTTLKIWNMLNSNFSHPKVFYDHEDAIISADVCEKSVISIDGNGVILIRNIAKPGEIENRIELDLKNEDYLERAIIKFNKADSMTFFLVLNGNLFVYEKNGTIINEISVDDEKEIDFIYQHKDCILIALEDGTITCYDWHQENTLYKITKTKDKVITAMSVCRDSLFLGTDEGEIHIFKV